MIKKNPKQHGRLGFSSAMSDKLTYLTFSVFNDDYSVASALLKVVLGRMILATSLRSMW